MVYRPQDCAPFCCLRHGHAGRYNSGYLVAVRIDEGGAVLRRVVRCLTRSCILSSTGAFALVLHGHIPYVRMRYFRGEIWLHESLLYSLLPLIEMLYGLRDEQISSPITLSLSPVLLEQIAEAGCFLHFDEFVADRVRAAELDIAHYEGEAFNEHLRFLAVMQRDGFEATRQFLRGRLQSNVIAALSELQAAGVIEIAASAATSAYLPLLHSESSVRAQIRAGIATYNRLFGQAPRSFWLPEHGYRPGLEAILAEEGIQVFFVEGHAITGGEASGAATGDIFGGYGAVKRQYTIDQKFDEAAREFSTLSPYTVGESGVAVLGRNHSASYQVWSNVLGYPGDFDYRDYHRKSGMSRLRYWRVTGKNVPLDQKDYYYPDWAAYKIEQHAENFAHLIGDLLRNHQTHTGTNGLVMVSFPTELFGWRWYEGIQWMGMMLRHLHYNGNIDLKTTSALVAQLPPSQALIPYESSWGVGGRHFNWNNTDTRWMWDVIQTCSARMEALADRFEQPTELESIVLAQTARELLLLQSGDWQLLISTNEARVFAIRRFTEHVQRFEFFADGLDAGTPNLIAAREFYQLDHVFEDIDFRWFRSRAADTAENGSTS